VHLDQIDNALDSGSIFYAGVGVEKGCQGAGTADTALLALTLPSVKTKLCNELLMSTPFKIASFI
jgi:hypothetical protein